MIFLPVTLGHCLFQSTNIPSLGVRHFDAETSGHDKRVTTFHQKWGLSPLESL